MKLSTFIRQVNATYDLGLDSTGVIEVHKRMRASSFTGPVTDASKTLDAVLQTSDVVQRKRNRANTVYASMKAETVVANKACGRCQSPYRTIQLTGDRSARYCTSCNITLPMKVA